MEEQMREQDDAIHEKQQQLKFYKEQRAARDLIMKQRLGNKRESTNTGLNESTFRYQNRAKKNLIATRTYGI